MAEDEIIPCEFSGFALDYNENNLLLQHQTHYRKRFETIEINDASVYSKFRSTRMKLGWLANTRPDCLFEISQLAEATEEIFEQNPKERNKGRNRCVCYERDNNVSIKFPKRDQCSLRIIGYSDASFANNRDNSSQLGYTVLLCDKHGSAIPLVSKSYKSRRITRSAMSAEEIAFSDMSDVAITIREELETLLDQQIPL